MVNRNDAFFRQEIKEVTFFIILGLVMAILLPLFFGFVRGGFEESFISGRPLQFNDFLVTYIIYYIMIVVALIGLPTLKIREMVITKKGEHPANQKNPQHLSVGYLHDPSQDGLLYNLFNTPEMKSSAQSLGFKGNIMKWSLSMFRMFVIGTLIFGGLGILQVLFPGLQVVGIPQLPFQLTPFGEVFVSAEPPAFAETMMFIFIFSVIMSEFAWISSKFKLRKIGYFSLGILACLITGTLWMGYHLIVYGSSEANLFATFIFGTIGSLLTLLFGSFIFWYVWHFWNNFFVKLSEIATISEDVVLFAVIGWVLLLVLYIAGEITLMKFRKKRIQEVQVPQ